MRDIFLTLAGKTDAMGNATVPIRLERTGEWRNVKVVLGTTGPAEWELRRNESSVNFGRGRRAVMGPELIGPEDTLTLLVTGGPPLATLGPGSCTGQAGSFAEILSVHTPMPNTVALDVTSDQVEIGTIVTAGTGVQSNQTFPLPAGAQAVGYLVQFGVSHNPSLVAIKGATSNKLWLQNPSPGVGQIGGTPQDFQVAPIVSGLDTSVICSVNDTGVGPATVIFFAYMSMPITFVLPSYNLGAEAIPVTMAPSGAAASGPAPWQRRTFDWQIDGAFSASGTPQITEVAGGNVLIVGYWRATLLLLSSAVVTAQVQLVDGGVTVRDRGWLVGAAGASTPDKDKLNGDISPGGIALNGNAVLQWDRTIGANQFCTLDMGGWFQQ